MLLRQVRYICRDVADPSHLPQFTQCEGLAIDKNITFGDLKGTWNISAKKCLALNVRHVSVRISSPLRSLLQKWMFLVVSAMARVAACAKVLVGLKS